MSFYFVRLADKPIHHFREDVRFRNLTITREFDSPELVASFIHHSGFNTINPGTTVLKTNSALSVVQRIVIQLDKRPTLKDIEHMNAAADKALFDAIMIAKTKYSTLGNKI
ncbi:hypothetical protein PR1_26 [Providencia phage vB_PreS_PR1]|uniref:Uncharacterized protein n=1 Tax=Providencia phage vB_PreS_PR1 TaxID=1931407 RepID=A0A1S6KV63_9CAUD|nr:hypothetical protein FDH30_gp027 [Providencia phage vB_PreS_PR1]AQT25306.1 hypothetical protein PR1_26 [Providencia phage vB_PreS_PR1]